MMNTAARHGAGAGACACGDARGDESYSKSAASSRCSPARPYSAVLRGRSTSGKPPRRSLELLPPLAHPESSCQQPRESFLRGVVLCGCRFELPALS